MSVTHVEKDFLSWVVSLCINELILEKNRISVTHVEKDFLS